MLEHTHILKYVSALQGESCDMRCAFALALDTVHCGAYQCSGIRFCAFWEEYELCVCDCPLACLQFCMLFDELIVGGLSLRSGWWMNIVRSGFELQHSSRCFVVRIFPTGQAFALQGEGVIEAPLCLGHVCAPWCSYVLLRQGCVLCIFVYALVWSLGVSWNECGHH